MKSDEYLFEGEGTAEYQSGVSETTADDTIGVSAHDSASRVYPNAVLNICRDTASVFQMKRKWEKRPSQLNLYPDFQRELVWSPRQKSELIESVIMGIPLPAFYVKEDENGVYIVVDGKQRFNTLFEFIDGKFKLSKLNILSDYEGKFFDNLSPLDQNKIEDYTLNIHVIKAPTSDQVTFDLFDRVNRGGTRINNQEMRNALHQGTSTQLIHNLAQLEYFKQATEYAIPSKHMKDRYLVLRFLAFFLYYRGDSLGFSSAGMISYRSNMEDFLGRIMEFINGYSMEEELIRQLKDMFVRCMERAARVIVPIGGFRLPSQPESKYRRPINMAFFESFCFLISQTTEWPDSKIEEAYFALLANRDYMDAIIHSVDNRNQIDKRYQCIEQSINNS